MPSDFMANGSHPYSGLLSSHNLLREEVAPSEVQLSVRFVLIARKRSCAKSEVERKAGVVETHSTWFEASISIA
jgi:hypothetical protein